MIWRALNLSVSVFLCRKMKMQSCGTTKGESCHLFYLLVNVALRVVTYSISPFALHSHISFIFFLFFKKKIIYLL